MGLQHCWVYGMFQKNIGIGSVLESRYKVECGIKWTTHFRRCTPQGGWLIRQWSPGWPVSYHPQFTEHYRDGWIPWSTLPTLKKAYRSELFFFSLFIMYGPFYYLITSSIYYFIFSLLFFPYFYFLYLCLYSYFSSLGARYWSISCRHISYCVPFWSSVSYSEFLSLPKIWGSIFHDNNSY